jgi:hypothetical protein
LVHRNIFAEVHAGFLMVGHTHEDIDQFFSTISSWLKKFDTICPDVPSFNWWVKVVKKSPNCHNKKKKLHSFVLGGLRIPQS